MKAFTQKLSGLLSASVLAVGLAVIAQPAAAQIVSSVHNLSSSGTVNTGATTTQICVFCHTPHGGDATVPGAPLWNRTLQVLTYDPYLSSTMDGLAAVDNGVSLACLSCHDGNQARDNMLNGPGRGNAYTTNLAAFTPGPANSLNLGTDLSNDHPIGMPYCGATTAANFLAGTCLDDTMTTTTTEGSAATRYWINTDATPASFTKLDLPLYGLSGGTGITVECATCHDPHSPANGTFLRVGNGDRINSTTFALTTVLAGSTVRGTPSGLCLTCHAK